MMHTGEPSLQFMMGPAAGIAAAGASGAAGGAGAAGAAGGASGGMGMLASFFGGGGGMSKAQLGAAGAGAQLGQSIGMGIGGLIGLGKRKSTGFGKAFENSLYYQRKGAENSFNIYKQYAPQMADISRSISSADALEASRVMQETANSSAVYTGLRDRVLSDLNDDNRNSRLEEMFAKRVRSSQAARGQFGSNFSALSESFQGLQFGEQLRQQAIGNAFGFLQTRSPFQVAPQMGGLASYGALNMPGFDLGLQQFAFQNQQREADINSWYDVTEGFGSAIGQAAGMAGGTGG